MIITRTPFRVSLFGGSTDYRSYYHQYGSEIIGFCIDKYSYVNTRYTPSILDYDTRVAYSKVETVDDNTKIEHDGVRGVLEYLKVKSAIDINHFSDLPAQTGTGSSSSFVVGLLHAIHTLNKKSVSKRQLADEAIAIERGLLNESGGIQDQIWAAYGGFNSISMNSSGYNVRPMPLSEDFLKMFLEHSVLIYTGRSRKSFQIAKSHDNPDSIENKHNIQKLSKDAYKAFQNEDLFTIGYLLNRSWAEKKRISNMVSSAHVDEIYEDLHKNRMNGKLLGSGGSGFIFGIFENIDDKNKMVEKYKKLNVNFNFDFEGSKIIYG
ncbi:MAG: kinase [Crocinitomicaceae bacterium]|nr:kinase [Crocinitomicaceae bacterium]